MRHNVVPHTLIEFFVLYIEKKITNSATNLIYCLPLNHEFYENLHFIYFILLNLFKNLFLLYNSYKFN